MPGTDDLSGYFDPADAIRMTSHRLRHLRDHPSRSRSTSPPPVRSSPTSSPKRYYGAAARSPSPASPAVSAASPISNALSAVIDVLATTPVPVDHKPKHDSKCKVHKPVRGQASGGPLAMPKDGLELLSSSARRRVLGRFGTDCRREAARSVAADSAHSIVN